MNDTNLTKEELIEENARLNRENEAMKTSLAEMKHCIEEWEVLHEAAYEGVMVHDKGVLINANEQYYNLFGYEPNELIGKQVLPITLIPETLDYQKRRITPDGITTYEIQGIKKDGSIFTMEVRGKLMKYRDKTVRGVSIADISEQKKIEDALRESEQMLRFLSTRLFEAQEQERSRVSKELHDQLGHDLVLLKNSLRSMIKKIEDPNSPLKSKCENAIANVDEIIENVRRISKDLMPSILEHLGLITSIQSLVENCTRQYDIPIVIDLDDIDRLIAKDVQINLYRIIQETLTNIYKHAGATVIFIEVKKLDMCILFRIKDNGKGFELGKVMERKFNSRGVGLTAMKERMNMLRGTIEINSKPGEGTEIIFKVPIGEKGE